MNSRHSTHPPARIRPWQSTDLLYVAALIVCAIFLWNNSFRLFKFFDMGAFIDMAWRVYKGQKPFVDFVTHVGPGHSYWLAFFFSLFGFGKTAIWACTFSTAAIAISATYLALRGTIPGYAIAIPLAVTTTGFNWAWSHPFYTHTAQAIGLFAVGILVSRISLQTPGKFKPGAAWVICGFSCVMAFLTKPNVGVPYTLVFLTAAVSEAGRRLALVSMLAGSLLAVGLATLFWVPDWMEFARQTIFQYGTSSSNRLENLQNPETWLLNNYWQIALIVLTACWVKKFWPIRLLVLFLGLYFIGIFEMGTSGAVWQSNVPVMGLYVALAYRLLLGFGDSLNGVRKWMMMGLTVLLTVLSLFLVGRYVIYGLEVKAWLLPDRYILGRGVDPMGQYSLSSAPLKGWKTEAAQGRAFDEIADFILKNVPATERLIIMTDLQLLNAVTGRQTLKGAPAVWTIGYMPAPGKPLEDFRRWFEADPPEWVVTHTDKVAFITDLVSYLGLETFMKNKYRAVLRTGSYVVLRRMN